MFRPDLNTLYWCLSRKSYAFDLNKMKITKLHDTLSFINGDVMNKSIWSGIEHAVREYTVS